MNNLYGLIIDGKVYELTEGDCFKCDFFGNGIERCPVKETCTALPYPTAEKDNCFRYSRELTDKINAQNYKKQEPIEGFITKRNRK